MELNKDYRKFSDSEVRRKSAITGCTQCKVCKGEVLACDCIAEYNVLIEDIESGGKFDDIFRWMQDFVFKGNVLEAFTQRWY